MDSAHGSRRPPPLTVMGWLRFDAVRRAVRRIRPGAVVELGCGEGALASWLATRARYVGVERDDDARRVAAARLAGMPDARVVVALAEVPQGTADLVCAFEVLEHIEDDAGVLAALVATLVADGHVLLSVPAHPRRFGASDELVGHFRRYAREDLVRLVEGAGLVVEWLESYGAGGGQVLDRLQDALAARHRGGAGPGATVGTAGSGRYRQPASGASALLRAVVAAPFRVVQVPFRTTDVGVGWVVLARRGAAA